MRAVTVGLVCRPSAAAEPDLFLLFKRKLQRFAAIGVVRTVAVGEFVGMPAAAVGIVTVGLKICFQRCVNEMFLYRHEELLLAIFITMFLLYHSARPHYDDIFTIIPL
jgi:hypothetical protein